MSQPKVQRNPLPNHKGKEVAAVVICMDSGEAITTLQRSSRFKKLFDQLELIANERRIATGKHCLRGRSGMLGSRNQS